ncbi:MAG: D-alanyl-D-alanine carboxypeptidase/D-alanyl-D-alanine endopeptidase [Acidimicrobiia bacterium]
MKRLRFVAAVLAPLALVAAIGIGARAWIASSDTSETATTTTTTTTTEPAPNQARNAEPRREPRPCTADPSLTAPTTAPPAALQARLSALLADPALAASDTSASVWIEGWGEVAALEPDRALLPASNEKIFTGMGALTVLGPGKILRTPLVTAGQVNGATLDGDVVVVGGGDPTLAIAGPHSLDTLAAQVRAIGITQITGSLIVDESRHDTNRYAPGWQDWQVPEYAGPLSAFMVDRNLYRDDEAYVADPALGNGEELRAAFARQGVTVLGPTIHGAADAHTARLAVEVSAPVSVLVNDMLLWSDNMTAEQLLREIGVAARGNGSSEAGTAAATRALGDLCVPLTGTAADGSGLSRADFRSAREWRTMLQAARREPWFPLFINSLPVGGQSGTLTSRFRGTPAEGNARAKTGSIIGGVALSGYVTTAGGRDAVFSVIVNGPESGAAVDVIDDLVATVAGNAE